MKQLPIILLLSSVATYASAPSVDLLKVDTVRDPLSALVLPENASPKDKRRAVREYLLLKAQKKAEKKKEKDGN